MIYDNTRGIYLKDYSQNNDFFNNSIITSLDGIKIRNHSDDNIFNENIIAFCKTGTSIDSSNGNYFTGNVYFFNYDAIILGNSSQNIFSLVR